MVCRVDVTCHPPISKPPANLSLGDERPCQRCIKRGLQDACQDGVRKKAKYLHDAPNEALMPGVGASLYNHPQAKRTNSSVTSRDESPQQRRQPSQTSTPQQFFPPNQPFSLFPPANQMPPPMLQERAMSNSNYQQQSPLAPNFNVNVQAPMQSSPVGQDPTNPITSSPWSTLPPAVFDDQSLMNFDTSNMNFASGYGAWSLACLATWPQMQEIRLQAIVQQPEARSIKRTEFRWAASAKVLRTTPLDITRR